MSDETLVLNNGNFVVVFYPGMERAVDGSLVVPPKLILTWYDLEMQEAKWEPISFKMAELLNPAKFAEAMKLLEDARAESKKTAKHKP